MSEHVITEVSIQRYEMEIRPDDITENLKSMDLGLEYQNEVSHKYECSCGEAFLKEHTAHAHLLEASPNDSKGGRDGE